MWRLDRPGAVPEFFDSEVAAVRAYVDAPSPHHVVWFDSFDYERFNVGRAA